MHHVAYVHQPESNTSADRRGNSRVDQIQFYVVNLGLVRADRAFELAYQGALPVQLLLCDHTVFEQLLETSDISFRLLPSQLLLEHTPFHPPHPPSLSPRSLPTPQLPP